MRDASKHLRKEGILHLYTAVATALLVIAARSSAPAWRLRRQPPLSRATHTVLRPSPQPPRSESSGLLARALVHEAQHLASHLLPAGLLVVHNARRGGQDQAAELRGERVSGGGEARARETAPAAPCQPHARASSSASPCCASSAPAAAASGLARPGRARAGAAAAKPYPSTAARRTHQTGRQHAAHPRLNLRVGDVVAGAARREQGAPGEHRAARGVGLLIRARLPSGRPPAASRAAAAAAGGALSTRT